MRGFRAAAGFTAASLLLRRTDEALLSVVGGLQYAMPPRVLRNRRVRSWASGRFTIDELRRAPHIPREFVLVLHHQGLEREAQVYLPAGFEAGAPLPFIFNFHGYTSDAQEQSEYTQMNPVAARQGFAVVHPQGIHSFLGYRAWNAGDYWAEAMGRDIDDPGFVGLLMEQLASLFPVADWFATGISNGGMLAYRLAHRMPGRFAAIAPVAAVDLTEEPIRGDHLGVFHVHGRIDGLVPFHDSVFQLAARLGGLDWTRGARESLRRFARHIGAHEPEHRRRGGRRYEVWRGSGGHVAQLVLHGGGHTWLGDSYRVTKRHEDAVAEGSGEIVRFFMEHRRR